MTDVRELMARLYAAADNEEMLSPSVVRALLTDSAAALAGMGWQPIATAPRDGTRVWVYVAAAHDLPAFQCACAWHPDGGWCADELRPITHWMPLLEPPGAEAE